MNPRQTMKLLAFVNLFACAFMLPALVLGLVDGAGVMPFVKAIALCVLFSGALVLVSRGFRDGGDIGRRDSFVLVLAIWIAVSVAGSLPFFFSGHFGSFTNALFESVSGYTTTGSSILSSVSTLPRSIVLWRSMIQWLGGMGIVLLTMAVLPLLGFGGVLLFEAEMSGLVVDKLRPRVRATAKLLWWVYALITVGCVVSLWLAGMSLFDAVCHAFTVMSTGGFSTNDAGIMGYRSPAIEWVLIVFMIIGACNFGLHYQGLRGCFRAYARNEEFRWYIAFLLLFSLMLMIVLASHRLEGSLPQQWRHSLFQIASLMTTTGYHSANFEEWRFAAPAVVPIMLMAMFFGGMGGSTSGGAKTMRIVVALKFMRSEIWRIVHPRAQLRVRMDSQPVPGERYLAMMAFLGLHVVLTGFFVLALSLMGVDPMTAVSATFATINGVGPGFGAVGPCTSFDALPVLAKWLLMAAMIIGRLEIYTVLVLFSRSFWRR